jgi:teichoic acid transport system permease protein
MTETNPTAHAARSESITGAGSSEIVDVAAASEQMTEYIEFGRVPKTRDYLRDLWARREFAIFVPYHDLRVQKINTVVGQFWHFLNPALTFAVYYLVFGVIAPLDRGISNYVGFLVIGIMLYTMMTRVMTDGLSAIESNAGLIRSVEFPRALLPITSVIGQAMAFVPALVVLFVALFLTGETPSLRWLVILPVLTACLSINTGLALLMARAGFAVRDLSQIIQHVFRLLFYVSGVLFLPSQWIKDSELGARLFAINPIYVVLTAARWALLDNQVVEVEIPILLVVYAIVLPIIGMIVFMRAEHRYAGS